MWTAQVLDQAAQDPLRPRERQASCFVILRFLVTMLIVIKTLCENSPNIVKVEMFSKILYFNHTSLAIDQQLNEHNENLTEYIGIFLQV